MPADPVHAPPSGTDRHAVRGPMSWPVETGVELTGTFVRLVRIDPAAHAEGAFAALDSDEVWEHFGAPRPADAGQLAAGLALYGQQADLHQWAVLAAAPIAGLGAGTVLGVSSYLAAAPHDARLEIGATAYDPAAWSTAVNPEAKLLLLRHAFDTLRCGRVQFRTDSKNLRSQRAIAGIGAVHEGTLLRYERRIDGTIRDTEMYSIPLERWPAVEELLVRRVDAFRKDR